MIAAAFAMNQDYERLIADAVAKQPQARVKASLVARKIAVSAQVALRTATPSRKRGRTLQAEALRRIGVKDSGKTYTRKKTPPIGSKIPVFLVVSNHWSSQWFEHGHGGQKSFPATNFMALAARAARGRGVVFYRGKKLS